MMYVNGALLHKPMVANNAEFAGVNKIETRSQQTKHLNKSYHYPDKY